MPALQVLLRLDSFEEIESFQVLISPDVKLDYARLVWLSQIIYSRYVQVIDTHVEEMVFLIHHRHEVTLSCFLDLIKCLFYLFYYLPFELLDHLMLIGQAIYINFHL